MPTRKDRRGLMPTSARFCVKLFSPCAPKYHRYTKAGMPILTTTRALRPDNSLVQPPFGVGHRKPRPQRRLEESLEQRRHCAHPERMDDNEMLGPADGRVGGRDGRRSRAIVPILFGAQHAKLRLGGAERPHPMARRVRALGISVGHRMAEMITARGMPLDDADANHWPIAFYFVFGRSLGSR